MLNTFKSLTDSVSPFIKRNWTYISLIIIAILVLLNLFFVRFYLQYANKTEIITIEKTDIQIALQELNAAYAEKMQAYELLKNANASKATEIEQLKKALFEDKERINKLANGGASASILKEEIGKLRKDSDARIAKLIQENNNLKQDNTFLGQKNAEIISQSKDMDQALIYLTIQKDSMANLAHDIEMKMLKEKREKEKALESVASANLKKARESYLTLGGIKISPINSSKKETSKAKKVKGLNICFVTIPDADKLVPNGQQNMIFQVIDPLGQPVDLVGSKSESIKLVNGSEIRSASGQDINYQKNSNEHCIMLYFKNDLKSGKYTLMLFHNFHQAGQQDFLLK